MPRSQGRARKRGLNVSSQAFLEPQGLQGKGDTSEKTLVTEETQMCPKEEREHGTGNGSPVTDTELTTSQTFEPHLTAQRGSARSRQPS